MIRKIFAILPILLLTSCQVKANTDTPFDFEIVWGLGSSSYNSKTGKLTKTIDVVEHSQEDYVTTYFLSDEDKLEFCNSLVNIDIYSYSDEYNMYAEDEERFMIDPSAGLSLTISDKTIRSPYFFERVPPTNIKGKKFHESIVFLIDILTSSEEWLALPEYEVYYL